MAISCASTMRQIRLKYLTLLLVSVILISILLLSLRNEAHDVSFLSKVTVSLGDGGRSKPAVKDRDPDGYLNNQETERKCVVIDTREPNDASYECVVTKTDPPYPVCIYDTETDQVISLHLKQHGAWEGEYMPTVTAMLRKFPDTGFIDIGANLAVYGLLAATMGHKTVVVEPWPEHVSHIHKSVKVGKLENKMTIVQNAIADKYESFTAVFANGRENQGALRMVPYKGQGPLLQSVLMDDLLEVIDFNVAIMKIDAEGYEDKAFKNSTRLFQKIFVPYILMEWAFPLMVFTKDVARVEGLISAMRNKGYEPFGYSFGPPYSMTALDLKQWRAWPLDIIWRHVLLGEL